MRVLTVCMLLATLFTAAGCGGGGGSSAVVGSDPATLMGGIWTLNSVTVNGSTVSDVEFAREASESNDATSLWLEFSSGNLEMAYEDNNDGIWRSLGSSPYTANASTITTDGESNSYSATAHSLVITYTGDYKTHTNATISLSYAR